MKNPITLIHNHLILLKVVQKCCEHYVLMAKLLFRLYVLHM